MALAIPLSVQLLGIPVQVHDALAELLGSQQSPSVASIFASSLGTPGYLRPLRLGQIKAVFDASQGSYTLAFRGVHVALFVAAVLLFVRALRVRTATDLAAAAFALTVFLGIHTFGGTVREAYPINHFLEMVCAALIALNLAQGRSSWWSDAAAALTFVAAVLILESGVLVWVVIAAAWIAGMRGVSWRGVAAVTVLLGLYVSVRFGVLGTGMPTLIERSSGYGFSVLDPPDLQARFGTQPLPFYLYNVGSSLSSILFAEPRSGVWESLRDWRQGEIVPRQIVRLVASTLTTILIAAAAWSLRRQTDDDRRLLFVFGAVLAANSVLSYAYTKDEILSVAGAFYAVAAYIAVRWAAASAMARRTGRERVPAVALCLVLAVASTAWAVRTAGRHFELATIAAKTRNDWVVLAPQDVDDEPARALIRTLRHDALYGKRLDPRLIPVWAERWFDE